MKKLIIYFILPIYFELLQVLRHLGLIKKPKVYICISTTKSYASRTIPTLVKSLENSGIPRKHIYIFEGGHETKRAHSIEPNYYLVDHNSMDFTALIEVCTIESNADYWFLLHDTCLVSKKFKTLIENIPHFLPDVLPIKHFPSMNMGAYKQAYLKKHKLLLSSFRNKDYSENGLLSIKEFGVSNEDVLLKQQRARLKYFTYNPWKQKKKYQINNFSLPEFYTNRICEYFPQVGIYKFKANYKRDQKRQIHL